MLLVFDIKIDLEDKHINVEYMKVSEIFAMFLGIFNALLALGFIAKLISSSVITEEIMEKTL